MAGAPFSVKYDWRSAIPSINRQIHDDVDQVIRKTTNDVVSGVKGMIVAKHIIDTGNYLGSWQAKFPAPLLGIAHSAAVEYGIYHEWGTYKMAARPHVLPTVQRIQPLFQAALKRAIEGVRGL